ncbi:MAG: Na/Pi cotransporter family protein [Bacilli bacterium]|nr:Na/Pi cotransporter family protein [Bacilli bacterium]
MEYFYAFLLLFGGLGAFLMGAKTVSDNTEKLANTKIRAMFNKTSKSKLAGVGIGAASTAIVQSSGLTTIMVVGLVNAGIMTLYQATTVIMGANIGTTITAQIASLQAFQFDKIDIAFTGIGMLMNMVAKKDKVKSIGFAIAGLGLVFMGLYLMKESMDSFSNDSVVTDLFHKINNPFLLLFLGIVLTALVQSSSAITSILISMASAGLVIGSGGNSVLFIILGSNIGSCVTAIMSSIGASRNAKRASLIHLMFNVFGSVLFIILLLLWPSFMDQTFGTWFKNTSTQIAMFHTAFNVICTIIFLPLTNGFVFLAKKLIKDKDEKEEIKTYLDKRFLQTPSLAIDATLREINMLLDMAMESVSVALIGFDNRDISRKEEVDSINDNIGIISKNITDYLVETSARQTSLEDEKAISALHHNNGDIVRISELADNITKYTYKRVKEDLHFSDSVKVQVKDMHNTLEELCKNVKETINTKNKECLKTVDEIEDSIDNTRKVLVASHIERMNAGICKPASSNVFLNLVNNLERIGDHLSYIAHSVDEL